MATQEAVEEVIEQVVEEATGGLSSRELGLLFSGVGIGAICGFTAGYLILNKRLETKYSTIADEEIKGMRNHYDSKIRAVEATKVKRDLTEVVDELGYSNDGPEVTVTGPRGAKPPVAYNNVPPKEGDEKPEPETRNVFELPQPEVTTPEWDYAVENKSRDRGVPFIIHRDEYIEGYDEHEKVTLTYFEGDDILCDEQDRVIEDQDQIVGLENLGKFGHGSEDPNIVYIRNHPMSVDIEVAHSDGNYATEVHGFKDDELTHSNMRRRPPRRFDDDGAD